MLTPLAVEKYWGWSTLKGWFGWSREEPSWEKRQVYRKICGSAWWDPLASLLRPTFVACVGLKNNTIGRRDNRRSPRFENGHENRKKCADKTIERNRVGETSRRRGVIWLPGLALPFRTPNHKSCATFRTWWWQSASFAWLVENVECDSAPHHYRLIRLGQCDEVHAKQPRLINLSCVIFYRVLSLLSCVVDFSVLCVGYVNSGWHFGWNWVNLKPQICQTLFFIIWLSCPPIGIFIWFFLAMSSEGDEFISCGVSCPWNPSNSCN